MSKIDYKLHYRTGVYRKFTRGTIVHLPFILHNYPILEGKNAIIGGEQVTNDTKKFQTTPKTVTSTSRVKSKKELWKQSRVSEYRDKTRITIESALNKLKVENEKGDCAHVYKESDGVLSKHDLIPLERINLGDSNVPRESIIDHYNEIHSKVILPRHGRFRPKF